jgi:two-component system, sensor histidine kinase YesM
MGMTMKSIIALCKDKIKIKNIRSKFFLANAFTVILPLIIVGGIASSLSSMTLKKNAIANNQNLLKNIMTVTDNNIKDMERLSLVAFADKEIQNILIQDAAARDTNTTAQLADSSYISQLFTNLITVRDNITGIYIFNLTGLIYKYDSLNRTFNMDYQYKNEPWFVKGVERNGATVIIGAHRLDYLNQFTTASNWEDNYVYSVFRQINSFKPFRDIGYILINQPVKTIADAIKNMSLNGAEITVINDTGEVVFAPEGKNIGENISEVSVGLSPVLQSDFGNFYVDIQGNRYLVTFQKSSYSKWRFISMVPLRTIMRDSTFLNYTTFITSLVCLLLILILSSVISFRITKPIKTLQAGMKEVGKGNFEISLKAGGGDELEELTRGFNGMTGKIKQLIQSEYKAKFKQKEAEIQQKEAELNSLRNQINPHFLYNTLESIRTLAALNGDKEVAEMTFSLANLFRLSMSRGERYVTIRRELDLINYYMDIQRIRFENKFSVQYDIPQELYNLQIPSFIIQPLVENAIRHGMEPKDVPGTIIINAKVVHEDILIIEISDDGVGMEEEDLGKLNEVLNGMLKQGSSNESGKVNQHIGLCNVMKRIHICTGEQYGLSISSNVHGGVTARLMLPVIK